jgi:hypothetical protein
LFTTFGAGTDNPSKKDRQHNDQKIPKRQSEARNQRRTDNTMAKRKKTKDFWLLIASLVSSIFSYDIIYAGI